MDRYFDAGATEVVFTQTDLGSATDQRRTWAQLGQLASAPPVYGVTVGKPC